MGPSQNQSSDDPVILILGVSNTGKSTFINWLLDSAPQPLDGRIARRLSIRDSLESVTNDVDDVLVQYSLAPGVVQRVILVDTPGFDHSTLSNADVLGKIAAWLQNLRSPPGCLRVGAVLYFHDISCDFVSSTMRLDLNVLSNLCGPDGMGIVTFVTTKWDRLNREEQGVRREEELMRNFWSRVMPTGGCPVTRVRDKNDALSLLGDIMKRIVSNHRSLLLIQRELSEGQIWSETAAGRCLKPLKKHRKGEMFHRLLSAGAASNRQAVGFHNDLNHSTDDPRRKIGSTGTEPVGEDRTGDNITILVMGEVHSGKSQFIKTLTGSGNIEIASGMRACTKNVQPFTVPHAPANMVKLDEELAGRKLIFIDTPGLEELSDIENWLAQSHQGAGVSLKGVLYLYDISREHISRWAAWNLDLLSKICGDHAVKQVAFVTTKWDRLKNQKEGKLRVEELNLFCKTLQLGASVYHVQPADASQSLSPALGKKPWDIVHEFVISMKSQGPQLNASHTEANG